MKKKPVILCIMDGFGIRNNPHGNAIMEAKKPHLDAFFRDYSFTMINASGEYVLSGDLKGTLLVNTNKNALTNDDTYDTLVVSLI